MKELRNVWMAALVSVLWVGQASSQCQTWNDNPRKEEAENAHVVYRPFVKDRTEQQLVSELDEANFKIAFDNWKKAYEIAPAADGQRPSHFVDGRKLYKALLLKATDDAKKKEYGEWVFKLYDEQAKCYKNEAFLMGRKAFDMFYTPGWGYSRETFDTFKKAIEMGKNDTEYIVYDPLGQLMSYLYKNKQVTKEEFLDIHSQLTKIAEHNKVNNKSYGQYHESGLAIMENHFRTAEIENEIFDCTYFKGKLKPLYEKDQNNLENLKYVYVTLKERGCPEEDPFVQDVKTHYEGLAAKFNEEVEKQRRIDNPCYDGSQLQREGKHAEALARYEECLRTSDDPEVKAQVYYSIAFIQTWELAQYATARENARKAASLKPNWGKPYILIGDMYARTSRSCGDDWDSRMAIIAAMEKYYYAKSIDSEVAEDANKRIGQYADALPEKQEGFMRGISEGASVRVSCWIGETVKVKYK